jgi:hypothetical protein
VRLLEESGLLLGESLTLFFSAVGGRGGISYNYLSFLFADGLRATMLGFFSLLREEVDAVLSEPNELFSSEAVLKLKKKIKLFITFSDIFCFYK